MKFVRPCVSLILLFTSPQVIHEAGRRSLHRGFLVRCMLCLLRFVGISPLPSSTRRIVVNLGPLKSGKVELRRTIDQGNLRKLLGI